MNITTKFACKCGFHTLMRFQYPGFLNPTFGAVTCDGCESKFLIRYTRPKDKEKAKKIIEPKTGETKVFFDTAVKVVFESYILKMILEEELESKNNAKAKEVKESHEPKAETI